MLCEVGAIEGLVRDRPHAIVVRGPELAGEGRVEFRAEGSLSPHGTHLAPDDWLLVCDVEVSMLCEVGAIEGLVRDRPHAIVVRGPELAGEGRVEFRAERAGLPHVIHLLPDGWLVLCDVEMSMLCEVGAVEGLVLASPHALIVRHPEFAGEGGVEFRAEEATTPHAAHLAPDDWLLAGYVEVAVVREVGAVEGHVLDGPDFCAILGGCLLNRAGGPPLAAAGPIEASAVGVECVNPVALAGVEVARRALVDDFDGAGFAPVGAYGVAEACGASRAGAPLGRNAVIDADGLADV